MHARARHAAVISAVIGVVAAGWAGSRRSAGCQSAARAAVGRVHAGAASFHMTARIISGACFARANVVVCNTVATQAEQVSTARYGAHAAERQHNESTKRPQDAADVITLPSFFRRA